MQSLPEHIALGMGIAFHAKNIPNKNAVISPSENSLFSLFNLILSLLLSDSIAFSIDKLSPIIVPMIKLTNKIKN